MRVFLIPLGAERYELYFEPVEGADEVEHGDVGWVGRQRRRLSEMLREAEAERHRRHNPAADAAGGVLVRWRKRIMRWIVERAAEQRLLWHLRTATAATLVAPADLPPDNAMALLRQCLKRDADRHLLWFIVHLLGLIGSVVLVLVPGPNMLGYFFLFTTVGHMLAWRGANQGLHRVEWRVEPHEAVTDLRAAFTMGSPAREDRVHAVASRLGLRHLATFVERLAIPPA